MYTQIITATPLSPDAALWGVEMAEYAGKVTGNSVALHQTVVGGDGPQLAWTTAYESLGDWATAQEKLGDDDGYAERLGKATGLFVPGSASSAIVRQIAP